MISTKNIIEAARETIALLDSSSFDKFHSVTAELQPDGQTVIIDTTFKNGSVIKTDYLLVEPSAPEDIDELAIASLFKCILAQYVERNWGGVEAAIAQV